MIRRYLPHVVAAAVVLTVGGWTAHTYAWGDGTICDHGVTLNLWGDGSPAAERAFYEYLRSHPGAKEGSCPSTTTTSTTPPSSSSTTSSTSTVPASSSTSTTTGSTPSSPPPDSSSTPTTAAPITSPADPLPTADPSDECIGIDPVTGRGSTRWSFQVCGPTTTSAATASATDPASTATSAAPSELPATGVDHAWTLFVAALFVGFGALVARLARRPVKR